MELLLIDKSMKTAEEWRVIKGYESYYKVSNLGGVMSLWGMKNKLLEQQRNNRGYLTVNLYKGRVAKTRSVHQLVAESFHDHEPCGHKLVINHINLNKLDNRADNLEIVTTRENSNLKHIKSTSEYTGVSWVKREQKWRAQIYIKGTRRHLGYFDCEIEASKAYESAIPLPKAPNTI